MEYVPLLVTAACQGRDLERETFADPGRLGALFGAALWPTQSSNEIRLDVLSGLAYVETARHGPPKGGHTYSWQSGRHRHQGDFSAFLRLLDCDQPR